MSTEHADLLSELIKLDHEKIGEKHFRMRCDAGPINNLLHRFRYYRAGRDQTGLRWNHKNKRNQVGIYKTNDAIEIVLY